MASTVCGWCNRLAHMRLYQETVMVEETPGAKFVQGAFECANCRKLSIGTAILDDRRRPPGWHAPEWLDTDTANHFWAPRHEGIGKAFPDVPAVIADAASEV